VFIGDTAMDAMLGKNYGVMLTIGLPGIVPKEGLQEHMDVVVDGLDDIQ
jgi:phosphoglycolate phosphatase-like HAD superfamily hydrolase